MTATAAAPAAAPAAAGGRRPARNPELDAVRGLALTLAIIVVVAPDPSTLPAWLAPSDWHGQSVADHLPAVFATLSGAAIAFQWGRHKNRSWLWWVGRLVRRGAVLVGIGLLLNWVADPSWPVSTDELLWTNDLVRIGVASVIAIPLVRLPRWGEVLIVTALLAFHTMVTLAGDPALPPDTNGLIGIDQDVLGTAHAIFPVDRNGVTALAPTLGAMLAGFWAGEWIAARPRKAATGGVLIMIAAWAGLLVWFVDVIPANSTLWTAPIVVGGIGASLAALGIGHIGTRWAPPDRMVAVFTPLGRNALPMWMLATLFGLTLSRTAGWRAAIDWLAVGLGTAWATLVLGAFVAIVLGRLAGGFVDKGVSIRA